MKHGKSCKDKKYYCKCCRTQISDYRKTHCVKCWQLGKLNHNYKGGTTKHYCKECGKQISYNTFKYGSNLCRKCSQKIQSKKYIKESSANWKGGLPNCIDCGKTVSTRKYKRCIKCARKFHVLKGKDSPFYGKTPMVYKVTYKGNKFKSFWEYRFAKWCEASVIKWEYETKLFEVRVKNKDRTYTPDFYLPEFDLWIEIKGWWRKHSLEKFNCFLKQYPNINIEVWKKKKLTEMSIL